MPRIGLRSRLFLSHVVVMFVGIITLTVIGKVSSPRFFVFYLESIEVQGISIRQVRKELVRGFEVAWSRGAVWSVVTGASAAGGLSYLVSKRIVQPLLHMEEITKKFAAGHLEERVPANEIPELDQLASSFNCMADSLEGVEQRRRELVSDLTHELRTPLTVLNGYLEGLADGTVEACPRVYSLLIQETKRMQRLVNDLQELSKMEAGYLPIHTQVVDLYPILASLVQKISDQVLSENHSPENNVPENNVPENSLSENNFEKDKLTFYLNYPPKTPPVLADPQRVEQILVNLLSNALRYTPGGSITLSVWQSADKIWIAVIDTGKGIAPEDLPHVFERFWRADRSRDRHSGGTGIGLAICRRLVELQSGTIHAESQLGQGSTFSFFLPVA